MIDSIVRKSFVLLALILSSALKSSSKTAKKTRTRLDQDQLEPKISRTGKDQDYGQIFSVSRFSKFKDQEKTS